MLKNCVIYNKNLDSQILKIHSMCVFDKHWPVKAKVQRLMDVLLLKLTICSEVKLSCLCVTMFVFKKIADTKEWTTFDAPLLQETLVIEHDHDAASIDQIDSTKSKSCSGQEARKSMPVSTWYLCYRNIFKSIDNNEKGQYFFWESCSYLSYKMVSKLIEQVSVVKGVLISSNLLE